MAVKTRTLWIGVGAAFLLGCFATYQSSEPSDSTPEPVPSISAAPTPSVTPQPTATVTLPAKPAPTVTVTAPPSDACKLSGELALQFRDQVYEVSGEYGDARLLIDKATKALAMKNFDELNKQLTKIQKKDEDMSGPVREMTEIEPRLEAALKECQNG